MHVGGLTVDQVGLLTNGKQILEQFKKKESAGAQRINWCSNFVHQQTLFY